MRKLLTFALFALAVINIPAHASRVDPPLPLEKLTDKAQLIVKVTALSVEKAEPKNLLAGRFSGPVEAVTHFRVVSVLKGDLKAKDEFDFHYKSSAQNYPLIVANGGVTIYEFVPGRSYLLWTARDADKWSPLEWSALELYGSPFRSSDSQGVLLAPDDAPVTGDIKQIVWQQTTALLQSANKTDVMTGIGNLAYMSRRGQSGWGQTGDFKNDDVAHAIEPLLKSDDAEIAAFAARALKPNPDPQFVTGASIGF